MRLSLRRPSATAATLRPPPGTDLDDVETLLRRYDPCARRRRRVIRVAGQITVAGGRDGTLTITGDGGRLARGLGVHLGGTWVAEPPPPGEHGEQIEDMLRVYVPRRLVPAEPATLLRPFLPGVTIREDRGLGLFWLNDDDSELTVSVRTVDTPEQASLPPRLGPLRRSPVLYECGIDDVQGPSDETAEQAYGIARAFAEIGGVAVDRYGFDVTGAADLVAGRAELPAP